MKDHSTDAMLCFLMLTCDDWRPPDFKIGLYVLSQPELRRTKQIFPSMSVEQVLSEHHILNSANCTKIHFPKYKLNIILLHNMPTEHILNWTIVIETFTYWTLSHLKIWSVEHHAIGKHTNWTKPQLNIAQFQLNKNLLEHWQIYQIFTDQLSTEHWTSANWTNQN